MLDSKSSQPLPWLIRHSVVSQVGCAFLISWSFWGIPFLLNFPSKNLILLSGIAGSFGPSLAALLISALENPQPVAVPHPRSRWLAGTAGASLTFLLILYSLGNLTFNSLERLLAFPLILIICLEAGFVTSSIFSLYAGPNRLFSSFLDWKIHPVWYAAALLFWPTIILLGLGIYLLAGNPMPVRSEPLTVAQIPLLGLSLLSTLVLGGPLGEEAGWRGWLLPRLMKQFNPLLASLLIGLIWSIWHLPLHYNGFYPAGIPGVIARFTTTIPLAILFTWLYRHTRGSLLLAVLLHTSVNFTSTLIPESDFSYIPGFFALLILVAVDEMWEKPRSP